MSEPLHLLTVEQLRAELTAAEIDAIPGSVLGTEDARPEEVQSWLAGMLTQACDSVVDAINTCSKNAKIRTGLCKVPAGCTRTALVLARHAVISAIPGMSETLEGSSRAAEYSTATAALQRLASCDLLPEYSLGDDDSSRGNGSGITLMLGGLTNDYMF